jgi:hypothetical protein
VIYISHNIWPLVVDLLSSEQCNATFFWKRLKYNTSLKKSFCFGHCIMCCVLRYLITLWNVQTLLIAHHSPVPNN